MNRFTETPGSPRQERLRSRLPTMAGRGRASALGRAGRTLRWWGKLAVLLIGCSLLGWSHPYLCGAGSAGPENTPPDVKTAQSVGQPSVQADAPGPQRKVRRRIPRKMVRKAKADMQTRVLLGPEKPAGKEAKPSDSHGSKMPDEKKMSKTLRALSDKAAATGGVLKFYDLPSEMRDMFPISVSMVVYSERPEKRSITVNGSRLNEGGQVYPGMKLEKITPEGAIFDYRGCRFSRNVRGD